MLCSILSNFRIYGVRIEDPPAVLHCTVREGSGSEQAAMLISKIFTSWLKTGQGRQNVYWLQGIETLGPNMVPGNYTRYLTKR
jgi:hypothetical protein